MNRVITRIWAGVAAVSLGAGLTFIGLGTFGPEPAAFITPGQSAPLVMKAGWDLPKEPPAAADRVIEVVDRIGSKDWKVAAAAGWLDRYTASDMRLVPRCSGKAYRCVTVRRGTIRGTAAGWTRGTTITIDVAKTRRAKYRPYYRTASTRTWLLAHELGHVFALPHAGGRNLMNPTAGTGRLFLTKGQRAHLAKR